MMVIIQVLIVYILVSIWFKTMPVQYCEKCNQLIDLDYDVEHFDTHQEEENE